MVDSDQQRVIGTQDRVTDNLVDLVVEELIFLTIIRLTVLVVVDQAHLVKDSLVVVEERDQGGRGGGGW